MYARRYSSVLEKLLDRGRTGLQKNVPSGAGLRRARRVLERVLGDNGIARLNDKVIHIVGTNGKGSVAWKTANALYQNAICERVGLYTSPHLFSVRERIRVNQEMIDEDQFTQLGLEVLEASAQEDSSYFELVTIMALAHFSRLDCDAIVLEAGMGGLGDATNVLDSSRVVALTSVDLDHVSVLGPTLEDICKQKIGVVKPGARVVVGPNVQLSLDPLITQVSIRHGAELIKRLLPLKQETSFDLDNARIARACVKEFLLSTQGSAFYDDDGRPPCRLETVFDEVTKKAVVLDVAHNPAALSALMKEIRKRFLSSEGALVFAIVEDKDVETCLNVVAGQSPWYRIEFPSLSGKGRKFTDPTKLNELTRPLINMKTKIGVKGDLKRVMRNLLSDEGVKFVLVCGSHGLMRGALEEIGSGVDEVDPFDTNERGSKDTSA